jgi:hypothetical protein
MIVVTGTAPRCGTSAMMRLLQTEFPVHSYAEEFPEYVAPEKNPEGFWDVKPSVVFDGERIPYEEGTVIKLWAPQFKLIDTSKVKLLVIMQRENFMEQMKSIYSCALAEGLGPLSPQQVSLMFNAQYQGIEEEFADTTKLRVKMNDLRSSPDDVLSLIKELI